MRAGWQRLRDIVGAYLANDDPLAAAANSGALLIWSSQPLYPVYVWLVVGRDAWPSLLTWLSTPWFFAVPFVGRRSSIAGRMMFVATGVANTLVSAKAFGSASAVGWFLVPCLIIATAFFRAAERRYALASVLLAVAAVPLIVALGPPLHVYAPTQYAALSRLNLWSVAALSCYLLVSATRARHRL